MYPTLRDMQKLQESDRAIAYCKIVTAYYNFITKRNIRKNVKVIKGGDYFDEGRTENIS